MDYGVIIPLLYSLSGIIFGAAIKKHEPLFTRKICSSVYLLEDDMESIWDHMGLDIDLDICVVNNSVNAHIWSIKRDFISETLVRVYISSSSGVTTIGWVELSLHLMEDTKTSWKDDNVRKHECILKG